MPYVVAGPWQPDGPLLSQGNNALSEVRNMFFHNGSWCAMPALEPLEGTAEAYANPVFIATLFGTGPNASSVFLNDTNFGHFTGIGSIAIDAEHGFTEPKVIQVVPFGRYAVFTEISGQVAQLDLNTYLTTEWATERPIGSVVGIIGNRLAIGRLNTNASQIKLSAIDNLESWDDVQGDTLTFPEGGKVQAIVSGDAAVVFLEEAIYRVVPAPSNLKHTQQNIARNIGLFGVNAWYAYGRNIYFLSESGFKALNQDSGIDLAHIGYGKVDQFLLADLDHNRRDEIFTYHDERRSQIVWVYPTIDDAAGTKSSAITLNYQDGQWGHFRFEEEGGVSVPIATINSIRNPPVYSDSLVGDIETFGDKRFDDHAYAGGGRSVLALDANGKVRRFGTKPTQEFGCTTKASDVSVLYNQGPPGMNRNPQTPPPTDLPPPLGHEANLNEVLVVGELDYGFGASSTSEVEIIVIGGHTSKKELRSVERVVARPTGKAPTKMAARRIAVGFVARNQLEACSIQGFVLRFQKGGRG